MAASGPLTEELLRQARAGDAEGRGRLLQGYRSYLTLLARVQLGRQVQSKVDPSDLVQETFLEAHRDFRQFRGQTEAELRAWLRRLLVHNLANQLRHYRTQRRDFRLEQQLAIALDQSSQALERGLIASDSTPSAGAALPRLGKDSAGRPTAIHRIWVPSAGGSEHRLRTGMTRPGIPASP
jgi:RNA polymerase sigma-70 factor (ECF subfamily)